MHRSQTRTTRFAARALPCIAGALIAATGAAQNYQRLIGDFTEESPRSLSSADADTAFIASGLLRRIGAAGAAQDMFITKVRAAGGLEEWTTQIGGPADDIGLCAVQLRSGEHILLGRSASSPVNFQLVLVKLNPVGGVLWSRIYIGDPRIFTTSPEGGTVRELRAQPGQPVGAPGDLAVATGNPLIGPLVRAHFLRTNSNGDPTFGHIFSDARYPDGGEHAFADFRELPDRTIMCVGTITERTQPVPGGPFVNQPKILLVRLTPAGAVMWARSYSYVPTGAGNVIRAQQGRGIDVAVNNTEVVVSATLQTLDAVGAPTEFMQYLRTDFAGNPTAYRVYRNIYAGPPSLRSINAAPDGGALLHANVSRTVLPGVAPPLPAPVVPPVTPIGPAGLMRVDPAGAPTWAFTYGPLTLPTEDQAAFGSSVFGPVADPRFAMIAKKTLAHGYDAAPNQGDLLLVRTEGNGMTTCMTQPMPIVVASPQLELGTVPLQWVNEPAGTFWQFTASQPNFLDTRYTCPGDYTADCIINFADINEVLSFFGIRYSFADLNLVLTHFGGGC